MKKFCAILCSLAVSNLIYFNSSAQTGRDTTTTFLNQMDTGFIKGSHSVYRYQTVPEFNCGVAKVSFQPGARTRWHSHAGGQVIVVTEGTGYYQEKGKPRQIIRQGDAIICPPNIQHWHGAGPTSAMTHVVSTPNLNKGGATAFEHVTDEEYKSNPQ